MNMVAAHWGVEQKIDVVKTEYWEKGLDTDQVPWDILSEYAMWDVDPVNRQIFEKQYAEFLTLPDARRKLIQLHMRDLLVLEEMEFNGAKYNITLSRQMGDKLEKQITAIDAQLAKYCPDVPISFNSDEQLSAFLYGGTIKQKVQENYVFHYKDAKKPSVEKCRWIVKEYPLPSIFKPLPNTDLQKEGVYSTDKTTLQKLRFKANRFQKEIIDLLLERSVLEKRKSTYCFGTPKLIDELGWEGETIHGQLNQTVVVTGRLSCSKPNLQNQDESIRQCFVTRFPMRTKL
jgi:DNA polymerase I-like protein with 3'-5' exonuclease and polymerase domains